MSFHFFQVLLLAGLFNALMITMAFRRLPIKNRFPAILLGCLISLIALSFISFGVLPRFRRLNTWFNLIHIPVNYFIGPLFLLFLKSIQDRKKEWSLKETYSMIPGILDICLVVAFWVYVAVNGPEDRQGLFYDPVFLLIYNGGAIAFTTIYLVAGLKIYRSIDIGAESKKLLQAIVYGMLALVALWAFFFVMETFQYPKPLCPRYLSPICIMSLLFFLMIGFKVMVQPKLLPIFKNKSIEPLENNLRSLFQNIQNTIVQQQLYLNPDLTQKDLCQLLQAPGSLVAQAIKSGAEGSFADLLNHYRVQSFLQKLEEGEDKTFTLFSLAQECGFKSRATFYRVFKKHTGLTPSDYKASRIRKE